jgi:hypothetical protein
VAGGSALLALAGPVGWAIGGVGLLTGGLLANKKNKDVAEKAERETRKVKEEISKLSGIQTRVNTLKKETIEASDKISDLCILCAFCIERGGRDFKSYSSEQQERFVTLVNITRALSSKLNEKVA